LLPENQAPDPWGDLRSRTPSRIGLRRSGTAHTTEDLLKFQLAHAKARDAVHGVVDWSKLSDELQPLASQLVRSQASDRVTYLRRPDLGRRIHPDDHSRLQMSEWDIAFVIADGLSADAITKHSVAVLKSCIERLSDWRIAPIILASQARVAIGDEIGARLGARLCAVLIGERPGLSVADSLGIYLTWNPMIGTPDSARNCISNIHASGLSYNEAASKLAWLAQEASNRQLTGVALKEAAPIRSVLATMEEPTLPN
jgi:ethanolamine ammonia-lyase small subunit